jgi:predicted TIM-barrel fold metal-dependent hydrolase
VQAQSVTFKFEIRGRLEEAWRTRILRQETQHARHLRAVIEWIGVDRLLFSSDYPHWDYDDARYAFKTPLSDAERAKIFNANARAVYKFD